jgi:hypothetical protein
MVAGAIVLMVLGKKILNMLVDSVPVKSPFHTSNHIHLRHMLQQWAQFNGVKQFKGEKMKNRFW